MTEADSDFFFGRKRETVEVIEALAGDARPCCPSCSAIQGVGKSSLAQAGVLAALKRQAWPQERKRARRVAAAFQQQPPLVLSQAEAWHRAAQALVEAFLRYLAVRGDRSRCGCSARANGSSMLLRRQGKAARFARATERRCEELALPKPAAFLPVCRSGRGALRPRRGAPAAALLRAPAQGLGDPRLLRADEHALRLLRGSAERRGAFRRPSADQCAAAARGGAARGHEPAGRAALGALRVRGLARTTSRSARPRNRSRMRARCRCSPICSTTCGRRWSSAATACCACRRQAIELGGVLAERADAFLAAPSRQPRTSFGACCTLKLATVREDGEPTRRRALRSEFTDEEWRLVSELADHPNRLLVTATPESGETYAEVAHEAIFRRWEQAAASGSPPSASFSSGKAGSKPAAARWEAAPGQSRNDALRSTTRCGSGTSRRA